MKFKKGDRVRVVRKLTKSTLSIRASIYSLYWNPNMDATIGKVYTIVGVTYLGRYTLNTKIWYDGFQYNFCYLAESLEPEIAIGQQLEFKFMKG